jgi:23S rRNA (guanosine2251-2'-O)-methyltransferase
VKKRREIILIAHNLRSCHNVGSLLRTAEGLGVRQVIFSGYTPYPLGPDDARLPHLAQKIQRQIHKTALGAEDTIAWKHEEAIFDVLKRLQSEGYYVAALEQSPQATTLPELVAPAKTALVVGREVEGIEAEIIEACDQTVEIPMRGQKESFNVVQAAAMALYHCTFL